MWHGEGGGWGRWGGGGVSWGGLGEGGGGGASRQVWLEEEMKTSLPVRGPASLPDPSLRSPATAENT